MMLLTEDAFDGRWLLWIFIAASQGSPGGRLCDDAADAMWDANDWDDQSVVALQQADSMVPVV